MLESLFKNFAGLKAWNFIKKRPQHRCFSINIAKFLILLISENICKRLHFDFFNSSLLHEPKGSRFRLYDGVTLQGLIHRTRFLFLSWHEPSPSPGPAFENLRRIAFDEPIKFLYWLFFVVLDGLKLFLDRFRSF